MGERIDHLKVILNGRPDNPEDNGYRAALNMVFGILAGGFVEHYYILTLIPTMCMFEVIRQGWLIGQKTKINPSEKLSGKIPANLS